MGKYESGTDKHPYSIRDDLLVCIANELAEANRLKRLELRAMRAYNKDVYNPAIKDVELEDGA